MALFDLSSSSPKGQTAFAANDRFPNTIATVQAARLSMMLRPRAGTAWFTRYGSRVRLVPLTQRVVIRRH
jgi:hypothetical protein